MKAKEFATMSAHIRNEDKWLENVFNKYYSVVDEHKFAKYEQKEQPMKFGDKEKACKTQKVTGNPRKLRQTTRVGRKKAGR